jgi:hypothetical protein
MSRKRWFTKFFFGIVVLFDAHLQEGGTAEPSVMIDMLERSHQWFGRDKASHFQESPEDIVRGCTAVSYVAGADTVSIVTRYSNY